LFEKKVFFNFSEQIEMAKYGCELSNEAFDEETEGMKWDDR